MSDSIMKQGLRHFIAVGAPYCSNQELWDVIAAAREVLSSRYDEERLAEQAQVLADFHRTGVIWATPVIGTGYLYHAWQLRKEKHSTWVSLCRTPRSKSRAPSGFGGLSAERLASKGTPIEKVRTGDPHNPRACRSCWRHFTTCYPRRA